MDFERTAFELLDEPPPQSRWPLWAFIAGGAAVGFGLFGGVVGVLYWLFAGGGPV